MSIRVNDVPLAGLGYDYTDKKIMVHDLNAVPNASTVLVNILDLAGLWNSISVGDKGDISVTNTGATWTINNNVVTFPKLQQIPARTLVGNSTGALANMQSITLHTTLAFAGTTLKVVDDSSIQQINVYQEGSFVASRSNINLIQGTNVSLDVVDDSINNKIDITVNIPDGSLIGLTNGDKGDIVVTGSVSETWAIDAGAVTTTKIADNNVTYAKLQQVTANRLLGNSTGTLANVNEISLHSTLGFVANSLKVLDNTSTQKIEIYDTGSLVSVRSKLNFNFTGFTYSIVEDTINDKVDVNLQAIPTLFSVYKDNVFVGANAGINLIAGSNVNLIASNNIGASRVDVTVNVSGGSTAPPLIVRATLDITGLTTIDLTTVQNANYIQLTSTNPTETISKITNFGSTYQKVRFSPEAGLTVTFNDTADNSAPVVDEMIIPSSTFVADGDYSDWIEVEKESTHSKQIDGMTYGVISSLPISYWRQDGNAGVDAVTQFLGTTDLNDLVFRTNDLERMRIFANGDLSVSNLSGTGNRFVYVDATGVLKSVATAFPQYSIPIADATNQLVGDLNVLQYQANSLSVGLGSAIGVTTTISLNAGRFNIQGSFNGALFSVGSGLAGGGVYDTSKGYTFQNRGNTYFTVSSTSQTWHTMFLSGVNLSITPGAMNINYWSTTGVLLRVGATGTVYTDITSTGTATQLVTASIHGMTFAATNVTTYDSLSTLYIGNAPTAGTNVTATNTYALNVNLGNIRFGVLAGTDYRHVKVNSLGILSADGGYKVYTVLLNQTSTSAPVPTILDNTLSSTITWARTSAGIYTGTLTGEFISGKTHILITPTTSNSFVSVSRIDVDTIEVRTLNTSSVLADDLLIDSSLEIKVFN